MFAGRLSPAIAHSSPSMKNFAERSENFLVTNRECGSERSRIARMPQFGWQPRPQIVGKFCFCLLHCRVTKNANIYSLNGSWVQFHSLGKTKTRKSGNRIRPFFVQLVQLKSKKKIAQLVCCENLWPMRFVLLKLDQITLWGSKFCSTFERDCS